MISYTLEPRVYYHFLNFVIDQMMAYIEARVYYFDSRKFYKYSFDSISKR